MQKKIVILSSGHPVFDERIFWKFGRTLHSVGFEVVISTSTTRFKNIRDGIIIDSFDGKNMNKKEKVNYFLNVLTEYSPQVVICCEPLPVLSAYKYKKSVNSDLVIIYDVTEWYPENYTIKLSGLKKTLNYIFLWLFNIYCSQLADGMTIGEIRKKFRYDVFAPFKKKEIISYYPVLEYFKYSPPPFNGESIIFCYAGLIRYDRGILNLLNICSRFKLKYPNIKLTLKLVGQFEKSEEENDFTERIKSINDFTILIKGWQEYPDISDSISDADICFDLRVHNFVYDNSLPIKVFEYMAAGKPFIFTDIKPLREILDHENFGVLVDPSYTDGIISKLSNYIEHDNVLLINHSKAGRKKIEDEYNWEKESGKFVNFINSFF